MPKFDNESMGVSFSLPERVTVRQQMTYYSEAARAAGQDLFLRLWFGARTIISEWTCVSMPKLDADIDELTDPNATAAIIWASMRVKEYMDNLGSVPKN